MIAHHLAVVGGQHEQRVLPLNGGLQPRNQTADLAIHFRDHAPIGRPDLADIVLGPIRHQPVARPDDVMLGSMLPRQPVIDERIIAAFLCRRFGSGESGAVDRVVHGVEGFGHHEGRMRAQEGDMGAPRLVIARLLFHPAQEFARQEGRLGLVLTVARRGVRRPTVAGVPRTRDRQIHVPFVVGHLVAARRQPGKPRAGILRQAQPHGKARQDAS